MIDLEAIKARALEAARHTNPGHHVDALVDSQQDVGALVAEVEHLRGLLKRILEADERFDDNHAISTLQEARMTYEVEEAAGVRP